MPWGDTVREVLMGFKPLDIDGEITCDAFRVGQIIDLPRNWHIVALRTVQEDLQDEELRPDAVDEHHARQHRQSVGA